MSHFQFQVVELMLQVDGGIFDHSQKWFLPQLTG